MNREKRVGREVCQPGSAREISQGAFLSQGGNRGKDAYGSAGEDQDIT